MIEYPTRYLISYVVAYPPHKDLSVVRVYLDIPVTSRIFHDIPLEITPYSWMLYPQYTVLSH